MKQRIRIRKVRMDVFSHATEDVNKVRKALLTLIPQEFHNKINLLTTKARGYYGNEITIMSAVIDKNPSKVLKHVLCSLTQTERNIVLATLDTRVDSKVSHIYLRISKQDAYLGKVKLLDGSDVIKVVVTVTGARNIDELREFLSSLAGNC